MAYGGNFYAIVPIDRVGLSFDPGRTGMMSAGLAIMDAINEQRRPRHPDRAGHRRLQARGAGRSRAGWRGRPQCHGDSSRLVRPLAVRYGHVGSHGGIARSKRACAEHGFRQRVPARDPIRRPLGCRRSPLGEIQAVVPRITGTGVDHRYRRSTCSTPVTHSQKDSSYEQRPISNTSELRPSR